MFTVRSAALCAVVLPCALFATGCGNDAVSKDSIEKQIEAQLGPKLPKEIKTVTCPEDLSAKVGKVTNCVITYVGGIKVEVRTKVTKVHDGKASLDMLVTRQVK